LSWNRIIGLGREKKILQRAILSNRVHHAYLFHGIDGIGKRGMAFEFAKTLNCKSPIVGDDEIYACEECDSCHQMDNLSHPNLHLIYSFPTGKATDSKSDNPLARLTEAQVEELQSQLAIFAENPYHTISLQSANSIKIDQIREAKKRTSLTNSARGKSVIIIMNADEMTNEAANAFLKTLEEPQENTVIILTTSRRDQLPPTILSRTQQLYFQQLSHEEVRIGLIDRFNLDETKARVISILANGSFAKAIDYATEEFTDIRSKFVNVFRTVLKKKNYREELLNNLDEIIKENDSKKIISGLMLFELWIRDTYSYSQFANKLIIINLDQIEIIQKFVENFSNFDYINTIEKIEKSINLIKKNVNIQLILVNLFLGIRQNVHKFY
jgi:DNA polymerase-3 subunit delta'